MRYLLSLSFFLFSVIFSIARNTADFTLEREIPAIKLTYEDFYVLVNEVDHLLNRYNEEDSSDVEISLILKDEVTTQTFEYLPEPQDISLPKAYYLNYQYTNYSGNISKIEIWLSDYKRGITVRGVNITEVESILHSIENRLYDQTVWFAGSQFRLLCALLILVASALMRLEIKKNNGKTEFTLSRGLKMWISWLLLIFFIILPWGIFSFEHVFPGFLILDTNTGFFSKNADMFTFFGFILALLSILGLDKLINKKST